MTTDAPISFHVEGMRAAGPGEWETAEGDRIRLLRLDGPPDLPADAASTEALAAFHRKAMAAGPAKFVELAVVQLDGLAGMRMIAKAPMQPSGFGYDGTLTLPFADRSVVVKVTAREGSPTGIREAVLFDRLLSRGVPIESIFGRYVFDAPEHDAEFPQHPVSRVRRALAAIERTIRLDPSLRALTPFPLPRPDPVLHLHASTADDDAFLFELHRATMRESIERTWGWDEEWQRRDFERRMRESRPELMLVDGERVGMLAVERRDDTLFIADIQVSPRHQGRGLGAEAIRRVIAQAAANGLSVTLQVLKANDRARQLYERLGFVLAGEDEHHFRMRFATQ